MEKSDVLIVLSLLCAILFSYAGNAIGAPPNGKPAWKIRQKDGKKAYKLSAILVKFRGGVPKEQRNGLLTLVRGKFKDKNEDGIDDRYKHILSGRLALIELEGVKGLDVSSQALRSLRSHPLVEYAENDYLLYVDNTPNDPQFGELWGLHNFGQGGGTPDADVNAPEAWSISTGSPKVIVGVIDTGVDYDHEDLTANIWTNPGEIAGNGIDDDSNGYVDDIHGINAITGSGDPLDDHGHGTHCSGTIGAFGNNSKGVAGVNWTVQLISMKFLNANGTGWASDAIECINYAIDLKQNRGVNVRVLSNSWGGSFYSQGLYDAIEAANDAGILFVAAAGNSSSNNDVSPHYPSSYPNANILAVASTDQNDNLSSFSNYGPTTVDLGAPGSSILSTVPGDSYATYSGTSMATPHVAGAAALLLSMNDMLTTQQLKDHLMEEGDPNSDLIGRCVSGNRLNVYNSLALVPPPYCNGKEVTILGTEVHDFIKGTSGPDVIHGLGGHDVINGLAGDDVICGGDGNDTLLGRGGNDMLFGGNGHDVIWAGDGDDLLAGGEGDDFLDGKAGNDQLYGNWGNDTVRGRSGVDELYGGWGPNSGTTDNNDTCYDEAGTFNRGCEVFYYEQ